MFRRVLIANRGEIALRIARGCRSLGVEVAAPFSEADRDAPWLRLADETLCIGGARAEDSYLNADSILQAAEQLDCQAIHPGYGFLAENAAFAARCEQQGITFIGPSAAAIRLFGDKIEAKRTMQRLGLTTIPGSDGQVLSADAAMALAEQVGYPVLLKATSGGGGRGMRRCENRAALETSFAEASLEAEKSFGDPSLYLEKVIIGGRHVEFQILCDSYGRGVHLGERECSIQRKHQKLVEEAPSPCVDAETRERVGAEVARVVAKAGYCNAGTVEFLRDRSGEFYFMEMNTRLQVEHPVTEMVSGVDLVAEQLRIAANCPLNPQLATASVEGHAIEFRINAEDPEAGFRPDAGTITTFEMPTVSVPGATVRWDSAIVEGYRITPHYDSMIGKLIVHAGDRATALQAAAEALNTLKIEGVHTTAPLHRRLLDDPGFRSGDYTIDHLASSGLLGSS